MKETQIKEPDLTPAQARMLELLWQGCTQECRERVDREHPEARKLIEQVLGRPLEVA